MIALISLFTLCALLGFYLLKKESKEELTRRTEIPFHKSNDGLTFHLDFNEQKDGSLIGVKYINSARFGMVKVTVYKGVQYSDNGLNYIEIKKGTNVITLDEMTENDLILIFTLIKKT